MENGNVNSSRNYAAPPLSLIYISMVKLSVKSGSNVRLEVKYSKVFFRRIEVEKSSKLSGCEEK